MRILYVEDHARFSRIIVQTFLTDHDVVVEPTVVGARRRLATQPFDAVLLDYDLADGKGTELLPDLLLLSPRPVIIAASSHEDGNRSLREAGADAVCQKADLGRIAEVLGEILRRDVT